jgi:5-carboxymethyl-2-hydroxymuconate isomerase
MPHIVFEFPANHSDQDRVITFLKQTQTILVETLPASLPSCKSRAVPYDSYLVGDGESGNVFYHLHVKIKAGRSQETLNKAAQQLLDLMRESFSPKLGTDNPSYSVEIQELAPTYLTVTS